MDNGYWILFVIVGVVLFFVFRSPRNKESNGNPNRDGGKTKRRRRGGYGKWIAGGLGWAFFGPLGGIIGLVLGSMFENKDVSETYTNVGATEPQRDFNISLLVLSAAVMKSDRKVMKSELDYVKQFYLHNFGQQKAETYIAMLREILNQDFNLYDVSRQIGQYMDYSNKLQLLHYLFGIAQADGIVSPEELNVIGSISSYMGISDSDFQSIKAMFVRDTNNSYKILGIDENATDDEVKKAYREMAKKNHPDLVNNLGEEVRRDAEKKFQDINAAYEEIKKQRGMS